MRVLAASLVDRFAQDSSKVGAERHSSSLPTRNDRLLCLAFFHDGCHFLDHHKFQVSSCERKHIARLKPRHKPFLDHADVTSTEEFYLEHGLAHDGADVEAVTHRQLPALYAIHSIFNFKLSVVIILL